MGIPNVSLLIKTAIEAALVDLRRNPWLLDDIFADMAIDPLMKQTYGPREIKNASDFFLSNNIPVYLPFSVDTPTTPCITVETNGKNPDGETLADDGDTEDWKPDSRATPQRQVIYASFTPDAYNIQTGVVTLPASLNTDLIAPGQFFASKAGKSYAVLRVEDELNFTIKPGVTDDFTDAVIVPATQVWNLRREQRWYNESFAIGVHAASDPAQCEWLYQILEYVLQRYSEAYLEGRGFEISKVSSSPMILNPSFQADRVFTRMFTIGGRVESSWVKYVSPKFAITNIKLRIADGPRTPDEQWDKITKGQGWSMQGDEGRDDAIDENTGYTIENEGQAYDGTLPRKNEPTE